MTLALKPLFSYPVSLSLRDFKYRDSRQLRAQFHGITFQKKPLCALTFSMAFFAVMSVFTSLGLLIKSFSPAWLILTAESMVASAISVIFFKFCITELLLTTFDAQISARDLSYFPLKRLSIVLARVPNSTPSKGLRSCRVSLPSAKSEACFSLITFSKPKIKSPMAISGISWSLKVS